MSGGDFHSGLGGWLDVWAHTGSVWGIDTDLEEGPWGWGMTAGADILFPLTSWLSFGMGAGYVKAQSISRSAAEGNEGVIPDTQEVEATPWAVPVRASFYGHIPLSERLDISLHAGASYYYIGRAIARYRRDWQDYWEEDVFDLKASGLGYHGGIGLELSLGRHISVFLEGQARWAKISGFQGAFERSSSEGGEENRDGTLYFMEYSLGEGAVFPVLDVLSDPPSGPAFTQVREAVVDFGGFGLVLGFVFRI